MIRTRAHGLCVEAYFQPFGEVNKSGLTELTTEMFQQGLKKLELNWADDFGLVERLFDELDADEDKSLRGSLTMDELAAGILDHVETTVEHHEFMFLEKVFQILKRNGRIQQLKDTVKFLNFKRDYTCSFGEFLAVFR